MPPCRTRSTTSSNCRARPGLLGGARSLPGGRRSHGPTFALRALDGADVRDRAALLHASTPTRCPVARPRRRLPRSCPGPGRVGGGGVCSICRRSRRGCASRTAAIGSDRVLPRAVLSKGVTTSWPRSTASETGRRPTGTATRNCSPDTVAHPAGGRGVLGPDRRPGVAGCSIRRWLWRWASSDAHAEDQRLGRPHHWPDCYTRGAGRWRLRRRTVAASDRVGAHPAATR
jgi:hypothetical protein